MSRIAGWAKIAKLRTSCSGKSSTFSVSIAASWECSRSGINSTCVAKTMIASEGSVPSAGWTYAKILGCLTREHNRNIDTRCVAELFVEGVYSQSGLLYGRRRVG